MGRGLVIGVSWYDEEGLRDRVERVAAGTDDQVREIVDKVIKSVTSAVVRDAAAKFLAPLLDNNEPSKSGIYQYDKDTNVTYIVWWKRCFIQEAS